MSRRQTRSVKAGSVGIGSAFPVTIQTMTNIPLGDVKGTLAQIERCGALGCDLIRAAVDDERAEKALPEVIRNSPLPLIADPVPLGVGAGSNKIRHRRCQAQSGTDPG